MHNQERYEDIISSIVTSAVSQIEGVADLTLDSGATSKGRLFRTQNNSVQVTLFEGNEATVDICVKAFYGTMVPDLAYRIQTAVKKEVESGTPYRVRNVNVNVVGVAFK